MFSRSLSDSQVPRDSYRFWVPTSELSKIRLLLDVPFTDHPYLIGPTGRKCMQLMDKYNVRIHFPDFNRHENGPKINHVMLFGTAKHVEEARHEIRERLPIRVATNLFSVESPQDMMNKAEDLIRKNSRPVAWRLAEDGSSCIFKTEFRSANYITEIVEFCIQNERTNDLSMFMISAPVLPIINPCNSEISEILLGHIFEKTGARIFFPPRVQNMRAPPFYFLQAATAENVILAYRYLLGLTSMQMLFVVSNDCSISEIDRRRWLEEYLVDVRLEDYFDENVEKIVRRASLRFFEFCVPYAYAVRAEILHLRSPVQTTAYSFMDELRHVIPFDVFRTCQLFCPVNVSEADYQKRDVTKPAEVMFADFYGDIKTRSSLSENLEYSSSAGRALFSRSLSVTCEESLEKLLQLQAKLDTFTKYLKRQSLSYSTNLVTQFFELCDKAKNKEKGTVEVFENNNESDKTDQQKKDDELLAYYVARANALTSFGTFHVVNQGDALVIHTSKEAKNSRSESESSPVDNRCVMLPMLRRLSAAANSNVIPETDANGNLLYETDTDPEVVAKRPAPKVIKNGDWVFHSLVPKVKRRKKKMPVVKDEDASDVDLDDENGNVKENAPKDDKENVSPPRTYIQICPRSKEERLKAAKCEPVSCVPDIVKATTSDNVCVNQSIPEARVAIPECYLGLVKNTSPSAARLPLSSVGSAGSRSRRRRRRLQSKAAAAESCAPLAKLNVMAGSTHVAVPQHHMQYPNVGQVNVQPNMYVLPPQHQQVAVHNVQYACSSENVTQQYPMQQGQQPYSNGFVQIKGMPADNLVVYPYPVSQQYGQPVPPPPPVVYDGNNGAYYQMCTPNGNVVPNISIQNGPVYVQQPPVMVPPGMVYVQNQHMQCYNGGAPPQFCQPPPGAMGLSSEGIPMPLERYGNATGELVDEVFEPEYLYDDPNTLFVIVNPTELPPMCAVLLEICRFRYNDCFVYAFMIPVETYRFFKRLPTPGRVVVKGEFHVVPYGVMIAPRFAFDVQFVPYVEEHEATYVPDTFPKPRINFPAPKSLPAAQEFIALTYGFDMDDTFMQINLADGTPTYYHLASATHGENQWDVNPCYGGPVLQTQYGGMRYS